MTLGFVNDEELNLAIAFDVVVSFELVEARSRI